MVIKAADYRTAEVYLSFEAEIFASGASSLRTVRRLIEQGFAVYHLQDLHAKIVLCQDFASVGSQNLTAKGTTNLEASLVTTDFEDLQDIRNSLDRWLLARRRVTLDMVLDLERHLPSLRRRFLALQREAHQVVADVWRSERQREQARKREEIRQQREERERLERLRSERTRNVQSAVQTANQAREIIATRIERKSFEGIYGQDYYHTLHVRQNSDDLTFWTINGSPTRLTKRDRYLLIYLQNGRLSWPALNRRQITQFARGLSVSESIKLDGYSYKLGYNFPWDGDRHASYNLEAKIRPIEGKGALVIECMFSLNMLEIVQIREEGVADEERGRIDVLRDSLEKDISAARALLVKHLLSPFRFTRNRLGSGPQEFFRGEGNSFYLRLCEIDGRRFLVASKNRNFSV